MSLTWLAVFKKTRFLKKAKKRKKFTNSQFRLFFATLPENFKHAFRGVFNEFFWRKANEFCPLIGIFKNTYANVSNVTNIVSV